MYVQAETECRCILEYCFKHYFSNERGRIYTVHERAQLDLTLGKQKITTSEFVYLSAYVCMWLCSHMHTPPGDRLRVKKKLYMQKD